MQERELACLAFTRRGAALAERICRALGGRADCARDLPAFSLSRWTEEQFEAGRALVFVGAAGIAVRAVAPLLRSKVTDPPVVALDEGGRFVIPLVSGHLGGANALAREIARLCGGTAVITTATDLNGLFAVDLWAKRQGLTICQPERIKTVSGRLLAGETVGITSRWQVAGTPPEGVELVSRDGDVTVDVRPGAGLCLTPPALTLGVGCRRGTTRETLEEQFARFCAERNILPQAVCAAASIDRKGEEAGLLAFCETHGWRRQFYTAAELQRAPGTFTPSEFVRQTVGVDNVCERAAALAGGKLLERKYAQGGVTFALSLGEVKLDWSW